MKTYDAYNRLATETDARGNVKTHSYEHARGLLLGTTYSDGTTARQYAYNHLGQLTQVTDDAGIRSIGYNAYGEQETDTLLADEVTHLITETRDAKGRSTGFTYAKNGTVQHTVTTGYGTDGRISTAGFMHGGSEKLFSYSYLSGSNLLQTLTMPCNMTLTQSYETQRDLLIGMAYRRGNTLVTQRTYSYDTLGRPLTRNTARNGQTVNDSFVHNSRSELARATVNDTTYGYDYDNIGNRRMAMEASDYTLYEANELNQYTSIQENEEAAFAPTFDADGNQTLVKTSTGIWNVEYNAENRPICFTSEDEATVIECTYDAMSRRATKKVITNGSVTLHQRYIYRGFLQIACCDLTRSGHPCLWLLTWEPSQPVATRPLAIRKDGNWFAYGWDLTKNICEVFGPAGYIRTFYTYSPQGNVICNGDVEQPVQWSSEIKDDELGLVYYNYRYYTESLGRWLVRDPLPETLSSGRYTSFENNGVKKTDYLGLIVQLNYTPPSDSVVTPYELGIEWLTGIGPRTRHFKDGDNFAELMRQHNFIQSIFLQAKSAISANCDKNCSYRGGSYSLKDGEGTYDLSGIEGVGKYLKDYSTLFTFGMTGNLAVTFTGSYSVRIEEELVDCCKNELTLKIKTYNRSHAASALRPPVLGYTELWQTYVAPAINSLFETGMMSQTIQTVTLTQKLTLNSNCPKSNN